MSERNIHFDQAVQAIIHGDAETLRRLLEIHPPLIHMRASAPHRSTLLHYIGANGIEGDRQKTPPNAVEMAEILLGAGAEVDALAETYGGGPNQTTLILMITSAHPAQAGLQAELVETLCKAGAAVNGIDDSGEPLNAVLGFMYPPAGFLEHQVRSAGEIIDKLVSLGARVDNLLAHAVLGHRNHVQTALNTSDVTQPQKTRAFLFTCMWGHCAIAEDLLHGGVDPNASLYNHETALHLAVGNNQPEVAKFLMAHNADIHAQDSNGQTPLDWAEKYNRSEMADFLKAAQK